MARKPRIIIEGWPLHVVQRGHDKQPVFFCDDDYWKYLNDLKKAKSEAGIDIHAYVLMTNHIHLLVTPKDKDSTSLLFQSLGRRYARYINDKYRRHGALWESRYKSCLIDKDSYLLGCSRYIEMNPVRAKMVNHPAAYPWSSYHHNARGKTNDLIVEHNSYKGLGSNPERRREAYQKLFVLPNDNAELEQLRTGINHSGYCGNDRFRESIEKMLGRSVKRNSHGGKRR